MLPIKGVIRLKQKVWVSSPILYVLAAIMLSMTVASWFWNPIIFYIELGLTIVAVAIITIFLVRFQSYLTVAMRSVNKVLSGQEYQLLQDFTLPVAIVGNKGDIIWVNTAFFMDVGRESDCRGENILKLIQPKTMGQVVEDNGTDIKVDDKEFTVFASKIQNSYILYFVNNTVYKEISREHEQTRPCVMIVAFDNKEELAHDCSAAEEARINAEVEATLNHWTQDMCGFIKKLSGGNRYLLVSDEHHIAWAAEKRFEILDVIRKIKAPGNRSATVSIGIGRGARSLTESEQWARQALDMALGRGGDQVAVKTVNDDYDFYGGLSKGVEKRDKVRTRVIAASISDHMKASDKVLIMGHQNTDLDAVGAAVGVWSAASKGLQKKAYIVLNRHTTMAMPIVEAIENANTDIEEEIFISEAEALGIITPKTLVVVVDTHSQDFVESRELLDTAQRVVVIDHHRMMVKHITNAVVFYHEPYASSTSEMVTELVRYIGNPALSKEEADGLLAGIMLDTKNFVLKSGVRTFEAAAYLRRRGADTVVVKKMFSSNIDTYKEKYSLISASEIYKGCAIACTDENSPNIRVAAAQAADDLLAIQGANASFVLFQTGNTVNISARSLGDINVQIIIEAMGGGGHLTMAGVQKADATIEQVKRELKKVIDDILPHASNTPALKGSKL